MGWGWWWSLSPFAGGSCWLLRSTWHTECSQHCTNTAIEVLLFSVSVSSTPWNFYFCKLIQACLPDKHGFKLNCLFVFGGGGGGRKQQGKHHTLTAAKHRREKKNLSSNRWHLNKCWTRQFINMLTLCFLGFLSVLTWWTGNCPFFSRDTTKAHQRNLPCLFLAPDLLWEKRGGAPLPAKTKKNQLSASW